MSGSVSRKVKTLGAFSATILHKMNEKMSFKMGVKCVASVFMGKNLLDVWRVFIS